MTFDVYAGLFGDDLDAVADLLDAAAKTAAADSMPTGEAHDGRSPLAKAPDMACGVLRARDATRARDLHIASPPPQGPPGTQ